MALRTLKSKNEKDLKWPKILISILSTIGIIDTGSITLKSWGLFNTLYCPGFNGCQKVLNSPWGTILNNDQYNIPLSFAGLITYFLLLLLSIFLLLNIFSLKRKGSKIIWWLIFAISCASSSFSILLLKIMLFNIEAFCTFCIISAILSISIFILSIIGARFESREPMIYRGTLIAFVVLISGLIWSNSIDPSRSEALQQDRSNIAPAISTKSSNEKILFAKFLSENGIVMYSAYWCPHCHDQKQLFGKEAVNQLTVIECAKDGENNQHKLCREKGIEGFPSWEINDEILSGTRDLNELAELTNYKGKTNF